MTAPRRTLSLNHGQRQMFHKPCLYWSNRLQIVLSLLLFCCRILRFACCPLDVSIMLLFVQVSPEAGRRNTELSTFIFRSFSTVLSMSQSKLSFTEILFPSYLCRRLSPKYGYYKGGPAGSLTVHPEYPGTKGCRPLCSEDWGACF